MKVLRIILPIVLGVVAAALNFMVLRGSIAPLELTAVRSDVKADTELTEDMLERLAVRADREVFKSAVPYSERGLLLGRRVLRPLSAGEVLLYADVHNLDEENVRLYLKPGEMTLTIPIKPSRVKPGLRRGDSVVVFVASKPSAEPMKAAMRTPATPATRWLGPFRLLSLGAPVDPLRSMGFGEARQVTVAVAAGQGGRLDPDVVALQEAIAASMSPGSGIEGGVLAIELYAPPASRGQ